MSGEFDLIAAIVDVLGDSAHGQDVIVGPGDDAAVLRLPPDRDLVVSVDTLVAGRHFPAAAPPDLIGYRALGVSVSDLAAMGAAPAWCVVSLTAEALDDRAARAYATGLARAASAFEIRIVGGNLARGPAGLCVTVHGTTARGACLTRDGAAAGDDVYVTGCVGAAALALDDPGLAKQTFDTITPGSASERYWLPQPRLGLGMGLAGVATAAIDISDGLCADLGHLCSASGVGCDVDLDAVPVFADVDPVAAVAAGDDYELAFTAPPATAGAIARIARETATPATRIGRVTAAAGVRCSLGGEQVLVPEGTAISDADRLRLRDLRDPSALVATCFGIGLVPTAPGTVASIAAAVVWWFVFAGAAWPLRLAGIALAGVIGYLAIHWLRRRRGTGDAPAIVIDEVAGCWLALALCPPSPVWLVLGVALFRAFDIVKPWPVSWADSQVPGALGIMLDDLLAGAFAAALLYGAWALALFGGF